MSQDSYTDTVLYTESTKLFQGSIGQQKNSHES